VRWSKSWEARGGRGVEGENELESGKGSVIRECIYVYILRGNFPDGVTTVRQLLQCHVPPCID
jgi:hypothetical protein